MILNVRGSSGSGKSYIAHELLRQYGDLARPFELQAQTKYNKNKAKAKIGGYVLPGDLVIMGKYTSTCGGVEGGRMTGGEALEFIDDARNFWSHVYFEGLFISLVMGRWIEYAKTFPPGEYCTAFLDTPMDVCEARVMERNGGKPITREATIVKNHNRIHNNIQPKFEAAGLDAPWIPHEDPVEWVINRLWTGGWRP